MSRLHSLMLLLCVSEPVGLVHSGGKKTECESDDSNKWVLNECQCSIDIK